MPTPADKPVLTIMGAGLSGALLAARLADLGYRVDLLERRPDPRRAGVDTGRSINLALSTRGLAALHEIGLEDDVLRLAIPMRGRMIHSVTGELAYQQYGVTGKEAINSISRSGLNMALLDAAERRAGVRICFNHRCTNVDFEKRVAETQDEGTGETRAVPYDVLLGADGAFSAVRSAMQRRDRFDYQQSYLTHAYKELSIPPGPNGSHRLEKHALHIWPRRSYMMIALPNLDGSFTCTLFAPFDGPDGVNALRTDDDIRAYFKKRFPDALEHMPTLVEDFHANPTSSLATVRCFPWRVGGSAALLGDAAHAVVPFYGQGMNASFEDVSVLAACLQEHPGDTDAAFSAYETRRKPDADAIAQLALDNFVEMRDHAGSPAFRRRKKLEHLVARLLPKWYIPLYTMVSFTTIPYAQAVARARAQDQAVRVALLFLVAAALALLAGLILLLT